VILAIDTVNATDWASLTPGFTWGVVLAVFSVIPPFLVWWRWPDGNARREQQKQRREAKDAATLFRTRQIGYSSAHVNFQIIDNDLRRY